MASNWTQLCQAVLTGSAASVFGGVAANTQVAIHAAQAWNPTAAPVIVDVFIVPPSGAADDATHVDRVQVPAGRAEPVLGLINQKMTTGMSLYAVGDGVTLTVSGVSIG
jgi:hypothetical protein